jgi:hypothetical protein
VREPANLLDITIELVRRRADMVAPTGEIGLTLREIAAGADVDFEWLSKFSRGVITDPGVTKVQKVHDFLLPLLPVLRTRSARARASA